MTAPCDIEPPPGTLAHRALAGDAGAWNALVKRHDAAVVTALVAHGVPYDRARELAQEVWLRLVVQARAGKLRTLPLPGLALIQARFVALDELRRARLTEVGLDEATELAAEHSPESAIATRAELAQVRATLSTCSASAQRLFALLYGDPPLGHAEAAAALGLSLQRVRQILCEVRKRLRDARQT